MYVVCVCVRACVYVRACVRVYHILFYSMFTDPRAMTNGFQENCKPFEPGQHYQFYWLHRLAVIVVTQANVAVCIYTTYDEYFNVTGMITNHLVILLAVVSKRISKMINDSINNSFNSF